MASRGILVITWNFPPRRGGMEKLMAGLCRALRQRHRVFVITAFANTDVEEGWIFRPKWPGLFPFSIYALIKGWVLLRKNPSIQVILGGSALVTPVVLILAKLLRRNAVINVHGSDLIYPNSLYQGLCVRWIRYAGRVVANSWFTAGLARQKKASADSIRVIPPGVDWERFHSSGSSADMRKTLGIEGRKVLLYVGRLARRKRVKEFIEESLERIIAEIPEVVFVIAGDNPTASLIHREDVAAEIRSLTRERGVEHHVRLLEGIDDADLVKVYQLADVLVFPVLPFKYDVEGFGIVIVEAAAAAVPSVAFRVGGIPDAIEDGRGGVLIEPGDYGQMSQTIIRLLRDDPARLSMGLYAQKRIQDGFGWEMIAQRYEALFES